MKTGRKREGNEKERECECENRESASRVFKSVYVQ